MTHREGPARLVLPDGPAGFRLPAELWARFHATHWGRGATVIRRPFAAPLIEPAGTFDALVEAGDRFRAGDPDVLLQFCVEHSLLLVDVGRHLPERADGSAAGYAERVTRLLGRRRFALVVEEIQSYHATMWPRLREFLRGIYAHTGLPAGGAKATAFFGNYPATPWGLHVGNSANFQFVVDGPKRIRIWPDAYWRGREDMTHRLDYERYVPDSVVLDGGPGDILFWPADAWHVGEAVDGAVSLAVSVALFADGRDTSDLLRHARRLTRRRLAADDRPDPVDTRPDRLAEGAAQAAAAASRATAALREASDDPELSRALRIAALTQLTGYGFLRPPAPLPPRQLGDDDVVRGLADFPTLWLPDADDELIVSAGGHAFGIAASPHVLSLLERLNAGAPHRVRTLVAEHAGTVVANGVEFATSPAVVRALLEKLVGLRALVVE